MRILIVQLARLGDVFMTWPVTRALKRKYPNAEIHFLARKKFAQALIGLESVDQVHFLPTEEIFRPIFENGGDVVGALTEVNRFVEEMKSFGFDQVINLTFSPVSSYLTHALSGAQTTVRGYSRTADGFLSIADDSSAYFYAQVGPGRANRIHVTSLFAAVADVEFTTEDWRAPIEISEKKNQIVIHVGASQSFKALSVHKWIGFVRNFINLSDATVVLIGSKEESEIAENISSVFSASQVQNLVGKTSVHDLFKVIGESRLVVGGDSVAMHIAPLVNVRCLNISIGETNFWETGPRAIGSYVVRGKSEDEIPSDTLAGVAQAMLNNTPVQIDAFMTVPGDPSYQPIFNQEVPFDWDLLKAIYLGEEFPEPRTTNQLNAFRRIVEANDVIMEQLQLVRKAGRVGNSKKILESGDDIIAAVGRVVPEVSPLIRWFQTEKIRIGPSRPLEILNRTEEIHKSLGDVAKIYAKLVNEGGANEAGV